MSKTVLTTDHVRDSPSLQYCSGSSISGLRIAQFTFAFRSEPSFDKIFQLKLYKY